jgi:hypothetical protein
MAFFTARVAPAEVASTRNRARVVPLPQIAVRMPGHMAEADLPEAEVQFTIQGINIPQKLEEINTYIEEGGTITAFDTSQLSLFFREVLAMNTSYSNTLLDRLLRNLQVRGQLFRFNPDGRIEDMNDTIAMLDPEVHQKLLEFVIRNNIHRQPQAQAAEEDAESRDSEEIDLSAFFPRDMESRSGSRRSDTVGSGLHYKAKYIRPPMIYHHRTKPRLK